QLAQRAREHVPRRPHVGTQWRHARRRQRVGPLRRPARLRRRPRGRSAGGRERDREDPGSCPGGLAPHPGHRTVRSSYCDPPERFANTKKSGKGARMTQRPVFFVGIAVLCARLAVLAGCSGSSNGTPAGMGGTGGQGTGGDGGSVATGGGGGDTSVG